MLVKVLDENRVKILMEDHDVELYDIPFEKLNYDDPLSRAFIYELIQKTYDQTGVNFQDCRVMIEVVPGVSRTYYILLTRMEREGRERIEFDKADRADAEMYIFRVTNGSDVLKLFHYMDRFRPEISELYRYKQQYYILLSFSPDVMLDPYFPSFLSGLEEFGGRCRFHYINESILKEWGELLLDTDAYGTLAR